MKRQDLTFTRPAGAQATRPPEDRGLLRDEVRLLVSSSGGHEHARFTEIHRFLPPGTLLVVNRSATLAASLPASGPRGGFRLNLSTRYGPNVWLAEPRPDAATPGPVPFEPGTPILIADLPARLITPYPGLPRLWFVRVPEDLGRILPTAGEPIRYGYLAPPFPPLAAYQTLFSSVPGSAEMPSAARPFTPRVVQALRDNGVRFASVVLHTGVSSLEVESERIEDHTLFPEPFHVPAATAEAVNAARREGRPVIAVGTTVVRALESALDGERLRERAGFTRRYVHPGKPTRVVDGLITGLHDPFASHLAMLYAIATPETIRSAYSEAIREGYLWHEFGDSHLILASVPRRSVGSVRGRARSRRKAASELRRARSRSVAVQGACGTGASLA